MTTSEVKNLLKIYYDLPTMIAEEFATIRSCEREKNQTAPPPAALADPARYYENEMEACRERIAELQNVKSRLGAALRKLDPTDRRILELAFLGEAHKRGCRRRPPWKEIADEVDYSESQTRARANAALLRLAGMPGSGMIS